MSFGIPLSVRERPTGGGRPYPRQRCSGAELLCKGAKVERWEAERQGVCGVCYVRGFVYGWGMAQKRIIITGAGGLVGSALSDSLRSAGYAVAGLRSRSVSAGGMDVATGFIDREFLEGAFAVIHLAGEPIAQRWSAAAKGRLLGSRAEGTRLLATALAELKSPPEVFISMSGINRYGIHRPGEVLSESSAVSAEGFLGEISAAWEVATEPASAAGIRTVCLRTGVVLSNQGGALAKMRLPFLLGLGGPIGSGQQHMSWIALGDLVRLIRWAVENPSCQGPVNAVAPCPVKQSAFAKAYGKHLGRPAFLPMPAFMVGLLFGQMGRETILSDLAVVPTKALAGGFTFAAKEIGEGLKMG